MTRADGRSKAIDNYNLAQDLMHSARTPTEDSRLLEAAFTSRYHWRLIGGEEEFAISDWLIGRIYAELNLPQQAIEFCLAAISHSQDRFPHWLKASLNEGLARAYKSAGKMDQCERFKAIALLEVALETDTEDADAIAAQIATI